MFHTEKRKVKFPYYLVFYSKTKSQIKQLFSLDNCSVIHNIVITMYNYSVFPQALNDFKSLTTGRKA